MIRGWLFTGVVERVTGLEKDYRRVFWNHVTLTNNNFRSYLCKFDFTYRWLIYYQ